MLNIIACLGQGVVVGVICGIMAMIGSIFANWDYALEYGIGVAGGVSIGISLLFMLNGDTVLSGSPLVVAIIGLVLIAIACLVAEVVAVRTRKAD